MHQRLNKLIIRDYILPKLLCPPQLVRSSVRRAGFLFCARSSRRAFVIGTCTLLHIFIITRIIIAISEWYFSTFGFLLSDALFCSASIERFSALWCEDFRSLARIWSHVGYLALLLSLFCENSYFSVSKYAIEEDLSAASIENRTTGALCIRSARDAGGEARHSV